MNAFEYILLKQIAWARNNNIKLIGSKVDRGRPAYVQRLDDNLFEPLDSAVEDDIRHGDGGELKGEGVPCKMQAVHSSSTLGVNVFQYWLKKKQIPEIAFVCGFCASNSSAPQNIRFEQKFPICKKFPRSPNIDVVIENAAGSRFTVFAIECKFSEAYSFHGHAGMDEKYLELKDVWRGFPALFDFAQSISPQDNAFIHLHPAQLIKHILGLSAKYGRGKFRLLYLWYDCVGVEGAQHRGEIEKFSAVAKRDKIDFHAMSYQELIVKLIKNFSESHGPYVQYISGRYL